MGKPNSPNHIRKTIVGDRREGGGNGKEGVVNFHFHINSCQLWNVTSGLVFAHILYSSHTLYNQCMSEFGQIYADFVISGYM